MENEINGLIDTFIANRVGISNHFLNNVLSANLQKHLSSLYTQNLMLSAGTGNDALVAHDMKVRVIRYSG
ncbi:MAG: hypothetical protein V4687_12440 [Bacteroidota bacterium]